VFSKNATSLDLLLFDDAEALTMTAPDDIAEWRSAPRHAGRSCLVQPRSLVLLASRLQRSAATEPGIVS
jgi:hypothetical protein